MGASAAHLAELEAMAGAMPVPADFDEFWARRMEEADAQPLVWELTPSDEVPPTVASVPYDLWFEGMEGSRLYAKVLAPSPAFAGEGPCPRVLRFHGYPGRTRSWLENASWAALGMVLVSMDNPGQGGRSQDASRYPGTTVAGHIVMGLSGTPEELYYVRLQQDIRILLRVLDELPLAAATKTFVYGDSQGGGTGLAASALNPERISAAAILYPFLSDFRTVFEMGADTVAYEGLRYFSRWFDADGAQQDELFRRLSYIDTASFAHLVRCPVLFGTGLADTVCPPETQYAVWNRLSCPKEHLLYPDFGHEEIQAFDDAAIAYFRREGA